MACLVVALSMGARALRTDAVLPINALSPNRAFDKPWQMIFSQVPTEKPSINVSSGTDAKTESEHARKLAPDWVSRRGVLPFGGHHCDISDALGPMLLGGRNPGNGGGRWIVAN